MSRSLVLDEATLDELEAASNRRGVSLASVLRELLTADSVRTVEPEAPGVAAYPRRFLSVGIADSGDSNLAQLSVDEEPVPPVSAPLSIGIAASGRSDTAESSGNTQFPPRSWR
ncbi:MAG: hypothetical protein IT303_06585 [Dehalococcoidia bacterium]|nr:hypothetical protein [Dehalococcoidia bacterium]